MLGSKRGKRSFFFFCERGREMDEGSGYGNQDEDNSHPSSPPPHIYHRFSHPVPLISPFPIFFIFLICPYRAKRPEKSLPPPSSPPFFFFSPPNFPYLRTVIQETSQEPPPPTSVRAKRANAQRGREGFGFFFLLF